MTDLTGNGAGENPANGGQEPSFRIIAQYIKDLSFESPNMVRLMSMQGQGAQQPEVSMNMGLAANAVGPDTFEVILSVKAEAKREGVSAFIVELSYAGIVQLTAIPQDQIEPLLLIEGPRLLFPFARNIVADLTRESGFAPLMLSPIDFVDMYRKRLAERQQQAGGQSNEPWAAPEFPN